MPNWAPALLQTLGGLRCQPMTHLAKPLPGTWKRWATLPLALQLQTSTTTQRPLLVSRDTSCHSSHPFRTRNSVAQLSHLAGMSLPWQMGRQPLYSAGLALQMRTLGEALRIAVLTSRLLPTAPLTIQRKFLNMHTWALLENALSTPPWNRPAPAPVAPLTHLDTLCLPAPASMAPLTHKGCEAATSCRLAAAPALMNTLPRPLRLRRTESSCCMQMPDPAALAPLSHRSMTAMLGQATAPRRQYRQHVQALE